MRVAVIALASIVVAIGLYMIDPWWLLVFAGALTINEVA